MRRRRVLALASGTASALLAGCTTDTGDSTDEPTTGDAPETTAPATTSAEPDGVYVQPFEERMSMQGSTTAGDYSVALMFTVPHTFWTVTGWDRSKTAKTDDDSVHLMAVVWDDDSGTTLPDAGVSVEVQRDGELVSQEVIYPMLSQPMGFHYGGNFTLPSDGAYAVRVSVGGIAARTTGDFEGRFEDAETAELDLEFTDESRARVGSTAVDAAGTEGALAPMETSYPKSVAPGPDGLPGTVRGTAAVDDAYFDVTTLESASRVGEPDSAYLAVSARTPYNDYELSGMALDATLARDGESVFEGALERTLSPDVGYHYGATVPSVASGDELTLSVTTPPQVGRHEGYETAFLDMRQSVTLSL
ncbi:DUF7350 domain-containing protein [Halobacterium yunchengense]|uniref:DUF7350 domain-containing protein n=1 Tax=Halobacterium yunchengense TaxID=3108497 RepID=UPI003008D39D